jgi:C1A family cysteine protease
VTKPKDQGGCGACWAFTAASTLESLAFIKGFDTSLQTYSIQQLVDCDTNNFQCEGGWMFEAYQYTQQHGIALEADYPRVYEAQTGACHKQTKVHFYNHGQEERDGLTNEEL